MKIENISTKYIVRPLTEADIPTVYELTTGNPQSEAFWVKNGFERTGLEVPTDGYVVVMMERKI